MFYEEKYEKLGLLLKILSEDELSLRDCEYYEEQIKELLDDMKDLPHAIIQDRLWTEFKNLENTFGF